MTTKKIISVVAKNKHLHIFLGLMTVYAGISEVWETVSDDFLSANIRGGHGVVFVGILHLLRSLSEFVESSDYLEEGLDQCKDDKTFRLGTKGYVVKRSKGKGASGFVAQKVT